MARKKKPTTVESMTKNQGKSCGECTFFTDECTEGTGLCVVRKTPLIKHCYDKACAWFKQGV